MLQKDRALMEKEEEVCKTILFWPSQGRKSTKSSFFFFFFIIMKLSIKTCYFSFLFQLRRMQEMIAQMQQQMKSQS